MQTEGKQTADGRLLSVILFSRSQPQRKSSNFTGNAIIPTSRVNVFNRTSHTSPVVESNLRFLLDASNKEK